MGSEGLLLGRFAFTATSLIGFLLTIPRFGDFGSVDPVLLNFAGGDLRNGERTEEGEEMQIEAAVMKFHIGGVTFPLSEDFNLVEEAFGCKSEGFASLEFTRVLFPLEAEKPVFSNVFCLFETLFLGALTPIATFKVGRALRQ